jgi:hypothetical protein
MTYLDQIGADETSNDDSTFLSAENKQEIAESQHPFWVVGGVPVQTGKYEPQTFYHIRFGNPEKAKTTKTQGGEEITVTRPGWAENSETWTLALSVDKLEERPNQMRLILQALALGDTPAVGPCFLYGKPTASGNMFWKVTGKRSHHTPSSNPTTNGSNGAATPQTEEADGIPFANDSAFRVT